MECNIKIITLLILIFPLFTFGQNCEELIAKMDNNAEGTFTKWSSPPVVEGDKGLNFVNSSNGYESLVYVVLAINELDSIVCYSIVKGDLPELRPEIKNYISSLKVHSANSGKKNVASTYTIRINFIKKNPVEEQKKKKCIFFRKRE